MKDCPREPPKTLAGRRTRRQLLVATLGLGGLVSLPSCGGGPTGPPRQAPGAPSPPPRGFLGLFPGASPPTPTPVPTVIRFAHWETGPAADALSTIIDRFSQRDRSIVVQINQAPFGWYVQRLQEGFATGQPPDVFVGSGSFGETILGSATVLDLTSRTTTDQVDLDAYWVGPGVRSTAGQLIGLPLWTTSELVYYNRDHLAQAKLPDPAEDWTWTDLLTLARTLTIGKPGEIRRWGILLTNDVVGGWGSFVVSNGGTWLDASRRRTTLGDSPTREALQWYVDAIVVHHVAPSLGEQQRSSLAGQLDLFLDGQASLFVNGTWEMPRALAEARFSWDVCRLPRAPRTGQSRSISDVQPGSIAKATRSPEQAWQLLRFLASAEAQQILASGKVKLPALKSIAADSRLGYAAPPPAHAAAAIAARANARAIDFVPGWQACRAAVVSALNLAFDGRVLLSEALQQATVAGDTALTRASQRSR